MITDSMLVPKDVLQELEVIKTLWGNEFDNLTNSLKEEIKKWLVTYNNENEDQLSVINQLCSNTKETYEHTFALDVRHDIIVLPMDYIKEWLRKYLNEIVNPE